LSDQGKVRAIVATFDEVDHDADVFLSGSIANGTKATVSFYNHDTVFNRMQGIAQPDAPPVGKGVIRIEGKHAVADLDYFMDTQRGREAFNTVKAMGADGRWSFAYHYDEPPVRATGEWANKGARRIITKVGPLLDGAMEVSPVKMPGGATTGTLSAKSTAAADVGVKTFFGRELVVPEPRPADLQPWLVTNEHAAREMLDYAARRWGLRERPTLRWFRGNGAKSGQWLADRNEIWVQSGLSARDTQLVVCHETFHALETQRGHDHSELSAESQAQRLVDEVERGEHAFWRQVWAACA
jgi:hypothetical protein